MKRFTFLVASLLIGLGTHAQIFSDNFDAYTTGALGPQSTFWTTWSGTEGGAEDGVVSATQAASGTKSVYLNSTAAGGGPQDCVLNFGTTYNSGIFTYQADFYVNTGKSGYFNFQGAVPIGTTWALNVNMANGLLTIDDGITADLAMGSFTHANWFTLRIEANLTLHLWEAFINGTSIGVWINGVNSLTSVDNFPLQGSQFYMDNVSFDHIAYSMMTLNAAYAGLDMGGNIASQTVTPKVTVLNAGTTNITSFDVVLNYGGTPYTQNVTGQNLASIGTYTVTFPSMTLLPGANTATVTISNINGGVDNDITDNVGSVVVNPIVPALGKMVVGEEGTGTWCQWCPRGAVYMDRFEQDYTQFWAGIAVHNGDPMTVTDYDAGVSGLIGGYPSALVDRGIDVDPSGMGPDFFARLQTAPVAFIQNGATWDAATRTLNVSVSCDFQAAANSNYKVACVLTEDDVTGTTGAYNQSNAYGGGANGVMGGFEALANPVPAAQMVYNHVARAIAPSFTGLATAFPATVNTGDVLTNNFSFVLPATWDETKIHIIGLLFDPAGRIDNAGKATITEAIANGYVNGNGAGVEDLTLNGPDQVMTVYPNPAGAFTTVAIQLTQESAVALRVVDMSGKTVAFKNYGSMNGASTIDLNTSMLDAGVYMIELTVNNQTMVQRLIVE